eukprot:CAMPEP_0202375610 /NCGR_PEP_ID=MMETSP1127-20130417/6263_1 /ASSEMBLY_ACC=CAM_ASM_000462 /TAXON_ID=3047 /ORGANISM="Dunaliella tertiolecta, Strain CCMP1320" /LENGTH=108 /DNA_ID=CAMNT_0048973151 /DNA_START=2794 /DNA_END=3119 /DNA_ORIENTATION=+
MEELARPLTPGLVSLTSSCVVDPGVVSLALTCSLGAASLPDAKGGMRQHAVHGQVHGTTAQLRQFGSRRALRAAAAIAVAAARGGAGATSVGQPGAARVEDAAGGKAA